MGCTDTSVAREFALEVVAAWPKGAEVDFNEWVIETPTPDDDYVYQGQKEFIPNPLVLSNGDIIEVTFGVSKSDGESANKKVAVDLINGITIRLTQPA